MNTEQNRIKHLMQLHIDSEKTLAHPFVMERFVLRNGVQMQPMPRSAELMERNMCFSNCVKYLCDGGDGEYVEGFALRKGLNMLIHHAWINIDGFAMDLTWEDTTDCEYYGVTFDFCTVIDEITRTERYGLLDNGVGFNLDFMFKLDKGLSEFYSELLPQALRDCEMVNNPATTEHN